MVKASTAQVPVGPFTGFGPEALTFFTALAAHQDRDWFAANKAVYDAHVRRPMEALVESLAVAFAAHDIPLTGAAKSSVFRIHRDVRFAKDKSPYKTHAGAVLSRDGTKGGVGILYIHVGGDEVGFMAVGFYNLEPADLGALRRAITGAPERWRAVEDALASSGLAISRESAMARMPRGFEAYAETQLADALKVRHLIVSRPIAAPRLLEPDLIEDIIDFARDGLPLLEFGRAAIDRGRGERAR